MAGRLKLITPPAAEPVSPAELRGYGRMSDDVTDELLLPLIATARQTAECYQNRAYINQTWEYVDDAFPALPLDMPLPPLVSLASMTITDIYGAVTTVPASNFVVDLSGGRGRICLKYGKLWPAVVPEVAGVAIRFVAGYGEAPEDVPELVKTAIKFGALWLRDHPDEGMPKAFFDMLEAERVVPV